MFTRGDLSKSSLGETMAYCSSCGTQVADGTTMCSACGSRTATTGSTAGTTSGLADNVAGMLAYLFVPAIIFLVTAPYNRNRFIRFHSFQCLFCCVGLIAISIAFSILTIIPFMSLIMLPVQLIIFLGSLILWIVLM